VGALLPPQEIHQPVEIRRTMATSSAGMAPDFFRDLALELDTYRLIVLRCPPATMAATIAYISEE
jgi:hypothetical protein